MWTFWLALAVMQRLGVSINRHKIDPCYPGINHAVDGRAAGAADANYFNPGKCFYCWVNFRHYSRAPYLVL